MRGLIVLLLVGLAGTGCAPEIGDSCGSSADCSATGDRQCDLAQPGGYCTIFACDPDTCPGGSVCVEWRFVPSRTAETWCMKTCGNDGDCRSEYLCVLPANITMDNEVMPDVPLEDRLARVIDLEGNRADSKICTALVPVQPPAEPDGGT